MLFGRSFRADANCLARAVVRQWRQHKDASGRISALVRLGMLLRTARHLRAVQLYGRLWLKVQPRVSVTGPPPPLRFRAAGWVECVPRTPSMLGPHRFRFLNEEHEIRSAEDWSRKDWPRLWVYNLHYFDDLNAVGAPERGAWHLELIDRWIRENPPGIGVGWEPYPVSLRIVNWIKRALSGAALPREAVDSLAVQTRWLRRRIERHLLGNHVLANAKALVFAGQYFDSDESRRWLRDGERILLRELDEQFLADGGHFERSPMYHQMLIEDALDLVNLYRAYGRPAAGRLASGVGNMLEWAASMNHPDGGIAFFNDAAFDMAPSLAALYAYADRLGVEAPARGPVGGSKWLSPSGYARLVAEPWTVFFDAAPIGPNYQPGHAHADTLSVEASVGARRMLVNSGVSTYAPGPERERQRGTAAHNTVEIDGTDSSEVWAGFRVGRRARILRADVDPTTGEADACHDGYARRRGRPQHCRRLIVRHDRLEVHDCVSGSGEHSVRCIWHVHPDWTVIRATDDTLILVYSGAGHKEGGLEVRAHFGGKSVTVEDSTYHPTFGRTIVNKRIVIVTVESLPVTLRSVFSLVHDAS